MVEEADRNDGDPCFLYQSDDWLLPFPVADSHFAELEVGDGAGWEETDGMSSGKVSENLPDSVDIPGCDFFLQFIFRVDGNPGRGKPSDQIEKLVDHDLEVIPEVAD
ncbi:MAG: hypothetical protein J6N80_06445 [Bacteroidales bacterium]|nr:hypothetical protein [Bacteroidales bacterium]